MFRNQRGQALVEFALVIFFFLMLVFGVIYSGMLFYDYSTLSNTARSVARERAISPSDITDDKILERYVSQDGKFIHGMTTSLYQPENPPILIETTEDDDVVVTIRMFIPNRSYLMSIVLPERYAIRYHMAKEKLVENSAPQP